MGRTPSARPSSRRRLSDNGTHRRIIARPAAVALLIAASATALSAAQVFKYGRPAPAKGAFVAGVPSESWIERNYCGPACLAMVLNFWERGRRFDQKTIATEIYDAEAQASYNSEMVLYPRARGFQAWSFQGDLGTLRSLLLAGIPAVVLTRPVKQIGKGHYRVVVGIDDERRQVVFHDPFFGPLRAMRFKDFLKVWELGPDRNRCRWTMAVVPEGAPFPFAALRDDPTTLVNLATAHYRRSEWARSREYWERARAALPRDPAPLFSLAMLSLREDKVDEAEARAREALALDAGSAYALDVMGLVLARRGKVPQALETLARASRLAPGEGFIRRHYLQVRGAYIDRARTGPDSSKEKTP